MHIEVPRPGMNMRCCSENAASSTHCAPRELLSLDAEEPSNPNHTCRLTWPPALPGSWPGGSPVLQSSAGCSFEPQSQRGWTQSCPPCHRFPTGTPWPEGRFHPRRTWHSGRGPAGSEQAISSEGNREQNQGTQGRDQSPSSRDTSGQGSRVRAQEAPRPCAAGPLQFTSYPEWTSMQPQRRQLRSFRNASPRDLEASRGSGVRTGKRPVCYRNTWLCFCQRSHKYTTPCS